MLYTNEYLKLQPRNTKALENRGFYEEGLERLGDKRKRKGKIKQSFMFQFRVSQLLTKQSNESQSRGCEKLH